MNDNNRPLPGRPPNETARVTPRVTPLISPRVTSAGRSMTKTELYASGRREAAATWSPSTRPVPTKSR